MAPGHTKPVAHCIPVTKNAIRVQLPGGAMYAPAFHEAASKTGARSGLPAKHGSALQQMVGAAVAVLNSGEATIITLEMRVHDDSISVTLTGKGCTSPTKQLAKKLASLADKKASSFDTKGTATVLAISFNVWRSDRNYAVPVDPNPPRPRWESGRSATSSKLTCS